MVVVTVGKENKSSYYIDTDSESKAIGVVKYKLDQRLDHRSVQSTEVLSAVSIDKESEYYNSSDAYDGIPLRSKTGWSYWWGDRGANF